MSTHSGRPSTFSQEHTDKLMSCFEQGQSVMETAAELKISRDTLYRWVKEYPEFGNAFRLGKEMSEAKNATIIKMVGLGQIPKANVAALQMYMRNTAGWDKFSNVEGGVNQTININQMNVLHDKSTKELLEYIQSSAEEVKDIIDIQEFELIPDASRATIERKPISSSGNVS